MSSRARANDTTSTYSETEEADEDVPRDMRGERVPAGSKDTTGEAGFRAHRKPEDSRDDLPQVIAEMAVTRDGIPGPDATPPSARSSSPSWRRPSPAPTPPAPSARPPT